VIWARLAGYFDCGCLAVGGDLGRQSPHRPSPRMQVGCFHPPLAAVEAGLLGFQAHYATVALPFECRFTGKDLLQRPDRPEAAGNRRV